MYAMTKTDAVFNGWSLSRAKIWEDALAAL